MSQLVNLTSLNLSQNERISNSGASYLASLTKLKALNLSNTGVTSDVLPSLKGMLNLQSLAIYGCKGLQGCAQVGKLERDLPNLKCMRLRVASVGDGTIDDDDESELSAENSSTMEDDAISFSDESSDRESNISFEDDDDAEEQDAQNDGDENMEGGDI